MDESTFLELLKHNKKSEVNLRDSYDAVFHMKTAADGAESFYTLANNVARGENIKEAKALDETTLNAWIGLSHLRVIDNSTGFEEKINRLINDIYLFLGIPVPIEIERKFLVELPNIEEISIKNKCVESDIIQTYLINNSLLEERRIRQRGINGVYSYYYTTKTKIDELYRYENEMKITQEEYLELLLESDTKLKQIRKKDIASYIRINILN